MNANDLENALRDRLHPREWALFFGVRDSTGYRGTRTADAIAMGLWPSAGMEIHGFELKVARSDWLRELRQPDKSTTVARYCDRWWLVAADDSVARPEELPAGWGLLVPTTREVAGLDGGRDVVVELKVRRPALLRVSQQPDRGFIASLLRAAQKAGNST